MTNIARVMLDLTECLRSAMEDQARENPSYNEVCVVSPQWSDGVMLDWCGAEVECGDHGCGQAWVRFSGMVPDESVDPRAMKCAAVLTITLDVGIGRCSATGDPGLEEYEAPSEEDYLSDFVVGAEDLVVLQKAIMCCSKKYRQMGLTIRALAPFGPEGGCFGTAAVISMQVFI